jgi:hypothetical protein
MIQMNILRSLADASHITFCFSPGAVERWLRCTTGRVRLQQDARDVFRCGTGSEAVHIVIN